MVKVLFVCLGNICRSPMAEAVFNKLVLERGLQHKITADSAGTSRYHLGEDPDPRTIDCAINNQTPISHKARQVAAADHSTFDFILAMDQNNYNDTRQILGKEHPNLRLMREFDPAAESLNVPDPYFGGMDGFQRVHDMLLRSCTQLLDHIINEHNL